MSTIVETLINLGVGKPADLQRYQPTDSFFQGSVLIGGGNDSPCLASVCRNIKAARAAKTYCNSSAAAVIKAAEAESLALQQLSDDQLPANKYQALVFDGSGLKDGTELNSAYHFFHNSLKQLSGSGRIVILARPHRQASSAEQAAAQRGLEGLCRSLAKECGKFGTTAQLLYVEEGAENNIDSALRYMLSAKSAYIDGQPVTIRKSTVVDYPDWQSPLAGKVALVTGASRGIGEAIARTLARDGARVLGLDVAPAEQDLQRVMAEIGGVAMVGDITSDDCPAQIADKLKELGGGDIVVHNAGVTRDKTLVNMSEQWWDMTININLVAAQRINRALLDSKAINDGGRIIGVSSMNGIAGQRGQSNYATSKAGVIGYVEYMAEELLDRGITVNAVAPGFIETQMTDAIPVMTREVGRRLNSLSQGGKPADVAEAIAFFANPASNAVTGTTLRVCGQSWLGA